VRDADDRLLGMTPFDLRATSGKPLQLTLSRDGFKATRISRVVDGERMQLATTLKREPPPRPEPAESLKRPTGYKDDPY